jgi:hypothetical protein
MGLNGKIECPEEANLDTTCVTSELLSLVTGVCPNPQCLAQFVNTSTILYLSGVAVQHILGSLPTT